MAIQDADTLELLDRFSSLINKYVPLAVELAPKIEEFGRYKKELQIIAAELNRRGVNPKEPESLKKLVEDAIQRSEQVENESQPVTSRGRGESPENIPETPK